MDGVMQPVSAGGGYCHNETGNQRTPFIKEELVFANDLTEIYIKNEVPWDRAMDSDSSLADDAPFMGYIQQCVAKQSDDKASIMEQNQRALMNASEMKNGDVGGESQAAFHRFMEDVNMKYDEDWMKEEKPKVEDLAKANLIKTESFEFNLKIEPDSSDLSTLLLKNEGDGVKIEKLEYESIGQQKEEQTSPDVVMPDDGYNSTESSTTGLTIDQTGVWSIKYIRKGSLFGPFPYTDAPLKGDSTSAVPFTRAIRTSTTRNTAKMSKNSCQDKLEYNTEPIWIAKKLYYRAVTHIHPNVELISSTNPKKYNSKSEKKSKKKKVTPLKCPECGKLMTNSSSMKIHMLSHTGEKPHKCAHCGKGFSQKHSLNIHEQQHDKKTEKDDGKKFKCVNCGKLFPTLHKLKHHQMSVLQCKECGKEFASSQLLMVHMRVHTGERPFPCPECGWCFRQTGDLQRHMLVHTGEKPYECPDCDKTFTRPYELKRHRIRHSGGELIKPFECKECGTTFTLKSSLRRHAAIHEGLKPFSCPYCEKCYRQSGAVSSHIRLQHSEKMSEEQRLRLLHQKKSLEPKPHKCTDCGKMFSRASHLRLHVMTHTGERPFACTICPKRYIQKSDLNRHQNQVHD